MKALNDLYPGLELHSNNYGMYTILEYKNSKSTTIQFNNTGFITTVRSDQARSGDVKDYMAPTVYGIGFYGSSDIRTSDPIVQRWRAMIQRCYDKNFRQNSTYEDATVCEEWHNFTKFYAWAKDQIGFSKEGFDLDKDILVRGNKIYSPETCVFVPREINQILPRPYKKRGEYPIGVCLGKRGYNFEAYVQNPFTKKQIHLGSYKTPEEAFFKYKEKKEEIIKLVADEYRSKIDPRVYNALIEYRIKITD